MRVGFERYKIANRIREKRDKTSTRERESTCSIYSFPQETEEREGLQENVHPASPPPSPAHMETHKENALSNAVLFRASIVAAGRWPMSVERRDEASRRRRRRRRRHFRSRLHRTYGLNTTVCRLYISRARPCVRATHFSTGYGTLFLSRARLRKRRRKARARLTIISVVQSRFTALARSLDKGLIKRRAPFTECELHFRGKKRASTLRSETILEGGKKEGTNGWRQRERKN